MADTNKPEPASVAEPVSPITAELQDFIALQRKEYGLYVANQQIFVGTALAYNPGDAVPIDNAERLGYVEQGLVVKNGSKEHRDLLTSLGR